VTQWERLLGLFVLLLCLISALIYTFYFAIAQDGSVELLWILTVFTSLVLDFFVISPFLVLYSEIFVPSKLFNFVMASRHVLNLLAQRSQVDKYKFNSVKFFFSSWRMCMWYKNSEACKFISKLVSIAPRKTVFRDLLPHSDAFGTFESIWFDEIVIWYLRSFHSDIRLALNEFLITGLVAVVISIGVSLSRVTVIPGILFPLLVMLAAYMFILRSIATGMTMSPAIILSPEPENRQNNSLPSAEVAFRNLIAEIYRDDDGDDDDGEIENDPFMKRLQMIIERVSNGYD
jgi:hypothetical protein